MSQLSCSGYLIALPSRRLRSQLCYLAITVLKHVSTSYQQCSWLHQLLLETLAASVPFFAQPIILTPLPSGCFLIKSSNVTTLPPDSMIFFAAVSDIEKAQTVSLWPRLPVPRTLPGTTTTSFALVICASLLTLISRRLALGPASSSWRARHIGALFLLKALRRLQIVLSITVWANICNINSYSKVPK